MTPPPPLRADRGAWILGAVALVVYLPGLWWGLPHATNAAGVRGWDVDAVTGIGTLAEFSNLFGHAAPDWYVAYPLFHYLVLAALYAPVLLALRLTGGLGTPSGQYPYGLVDPAGTLVTLSLIGRTVSLLMACATVIVAYRTADRLWGRRAGWFAALAVLLTEPMAFYARTGNLDVPALFWTALGIGVAAAIATDGYTVRRGIWLGLCAAAAVGTKDQAYGVFVPLIVVLALTMARRPADAPRFRGPLATLVAGAAGYAVTSGFLLSPARFVAHLQFVTGFQRSFYSVVHLEGLLLPATVAGYARLGSQVVQSALEASGPLLLALGLVGVVLAWRRERAFTIVLLAALVGSVVLVIGPVRHMAYRYILTPAYLLALTAGLAVADGLGRRGWRRGLALMAGGLALVWMGSRSADLTYQMLMDARLSAGRWLAVHSRPGERLVYFGAAHQLPAIPNGVVPVRLGEGDDADAALSQDPPRWVYVAPDYFADAQRVRSGFLQARVYAGLVNGSLGYRRAAYFPSRTLFGRPSQQLPYVNPQVQIFERRAGNSRTGP